MITQFFVQMRCPDFNDMIAAAKVRGGKHWSAYAQLKKQYSSDVGLLIRDFYRKEKINMPNIPKTQPVSLRFDWWEENKKRDPDNLAGGGRKIILDACCAIGLLPHDGWKLYAEDEVAIQETFHVVKPKQKVGVLVSILPAGEVA
jgi:hypothetical protein